jgi:hypothetical protein
MGEQGNGEGGFLSTASIIGFCQLELANIGCFALSGIELN